MMKRLLSALGAGCFLMLAALWLTGADTGVVPVSGGGGGCAIVSMALSNNTFDSGTPNAAVGTVSTTTTGACASPTYAMVSSGSDHASTACNTSSGADFTVTGAAVAANGSPGPGPYNSICISSTIASATGSPFVQAFNITGAAVSCTITGVSISNNTFNSNIANAAVGMLSATTTGTCGAATYAIVSSGTDHSGTTCNAASGTDFTATAGAVAANGSPGAGTYTAICASATIGGATGSPFTQAFTITGAPNTTLTQLQAINSGSTQTNVPFSVGVPFDISTMDGSHHLTASDSTNGTLTCDETNRYSDLGGLNSGTAQVRGTTLSCNLPSWPNGADNITVAIASGAPGSGTDISTSDLTTASFDLTATVVTMNGTTETAQLSTAFANVGFVDITTPAILGKWRSGGGVVTGYVFFMPFKNGGTADPNGLYGLFDVECYKAHTTAVNVSTNPILGCHIDLLAGNGVAELATPLGASYSLLGYGISFAGGAGGTTTMTNWAATAPTQTLTFTNHKFTATITNASPSVISFPTTIVALSDSSTFFLTTTGALPTGWSTGTPYALTSKSFNGTTGTITGALTFGGASINASSAGSGVHTIWPEIIGTVTASAPLWTSDSVGTVISDGTFYGVITNVSSSTVADVSIYRPLPGLSTLTSGNYRLLPINHYYASRVHFSGDWVNTATAAPLRVQNGNLYLGNAWDNSAHTGGPAPYLVSAKAMPNYNIIADPGVTAFASYFTNCPSTLNLGACSGTLGTNQGSNPSSYGSIASATGAGSIEGQACGGLGGSITITNGPYLPSQQAGGDNGTIYIHPARNVGGAFKYDQYAALAMFTNVDKFARAPINVISNALGAYPASDVNSYSFAVPPIGGYTIMASAGGWVGSVAFGYNNACWFDNPNGGHAVNQFALPYQMTGDWYIMTHELEYAFGLAGTLSSAGGHGLDQHWVGSAGSADEERQQAWPLMIQAELVSFLPDSSTSTSTDAYKVLGGLTKTDAKTWLSAQWLSTGQGQKNYLCNTPLSSPPFLECPGTIYSPGVNASCPAGGTCNPGFTNVSSPDLRFFGPEAAGFGFETGYWYNVFGIVAERGMCDANCQQAYLWMMQGQSSYVTNTSNPSFPGSAIAAGTLEHVDTSRSPGHPCQWFQTGASAPTWVNCWRGAFVTGFIGADNIGIARYPSGTISLSSGFGTPGNTITATMPASGYIASGGTTYYAGGFLVTSDNGFCSPIIAVTSATTFTCTVVNAFGSSSYTNTSVPSTGQLDGITLTWEIPQPAGGDAVGLEAAWLQLNGQPGAGGVHYANIQQSGCIMANEYIGFPSTSTCNVINNFSVNPDAAGFPTQADPITFNIAPR